MHTSPACYCLFTRPLLLLLLIGTAAGFRHTNVGSGAKHVGGVEGLPSGRAWKDRETRKLARTELASCIDPETDWAADLAGPTPWLGTLHHAVESALAEGQAVHVQSSWRPLTLEPFTEPVSARIGRWIGKSVTPYHRAVILTSDHNHTVPARMDYPDSQCFLFDYAASPGTVPDPHGCGLFRHSFSRLKNLRQCIVNELEASHTWQLYRVVATAMPDEQPSKNITNAGFLRTLKLKSEHVFQEIRDAANDGRQDPWELLLKPLTRALFAGQHDKNHSWFFENLTMEDLALLTDIQQNMSDAEASNIDFMTPVVFDAHNRADEMIKYVTFKDWVPLDNGLINLVDRKIAESVTGIKLPSSVISSIRGKCFNVNFDSYASLTQEAKVLKRAMPCYPLMWDAAEVAGAPHKPLNNAFTMWGGKQFMTPVEIKMNFTHTPPVCGRIALAMTKRSIVRAPTYKPQSCQLGTMKWEQCLGLKHFNCICTEKCWVAALKRACLLSEGCCADSDMTNEYDSFGRLNQYTGQLGY